MDWSVLNSNVVLNEGLAPAPVQKVPHDCVSSFEKQKLSALNRITALPRVESVKFLVQ